MLRIRLDRFCLDSLGVLAFGTRESSQDSLVTGRSHDAQDWTALWPVLLALSLGFFHRPPALSFLLVSLAGCYPSGEEVSRRIGGPVPRATHYVSAYHLSSDERTSGYSPALSSLSPSSGLPLARCLSDDLILRADQPRDTDTTAYYLIRSRRNPREPPPVPYGPLVAPTGRDATRCDAASTRGYTALGFCAIQDIPGPLSTGPL